MWVMGSVVLLTVYMVRAGPHSEHGALTMHSCNHTKFLFSMSIKKPRHAGRKASVKREGKQL